MKTHCKNGHEFTPENTYWMQPSARKKLRRVCRACAKMRGQQWRAANPEQARKNISTWRAANRERHNARARITARQRYSPEIARKKHVRRVYGLDAATYDQMLAEQNGCCAICGDFLSSTICVDHNHATNEIRELLCRPCNQTLGFAEENPTRLQNAAMYLIKHTKKAAA